MNHQNISSGFFYVIISLALIGFVTQLLTNPVQLVTFIFTFLLIGFIVYRIARFILQKSMHRPDPTRTKDRKKYDRAVKQSHLQQKEKRKKASRQPKRPASHLKVIDGEKKQKERSDSLP